MSKFNYDAPAELFPAPTRKAKKGGKYRRFDTAADAIRYVVEELPAQMVSGTILETENERVAGFVYIGTAKEKPEERERPALAAVVTQWRP